MTVSDWCPALPVWSSNPVSPHKQTERPFAKWVWDGGSGDGGEGEIEVGVLGAVCRIAPPVAGPRDLCLPRRVPGSQAACNEPPAISTSAVPKRTFLLSVLDRQTHGGFGAAIVPFFPVRREAPFLLVLHPACTAHHSPHFAFRDRPSHRRLPRQRQSTPHLSVSITT